MFWTPLRLLNRNCVHLWGVSIVLLNISVLCAAAVGTSVCLFWKRSECLTTGWRRASVYVPEIHYLYNKLNIIALVMIETPWSLWHQCNVTGKFYQHFHYAGCCIWGSLPCIWRTQFYIFKMGFPWPSYASACVADGLDRQHPRADGLGWRCSGASALPIRAMAITHFTDNCKLLGTAPMLPMAGNVALTNLSGQMIWILRCL